MAEITDEPLFGKGVAPTAAKQVQGNVMQSQDDITTKPHVRVSALEALSSLAINGNLSQMREQMASAKYVAGKLALAGQITVLYAGPNTGKTLLTLKLVSEALAVGEALDYVFHINLDDTYEGAITKAELGNRFGFSVLTPEQFSLPAEYFEELVERVLADNEARKALFILDTVKKFTDVMDKKASSQFMSTCRKFTASGGTIIALAHTNKNKGQDTHGVPGGTSDILDDCDCAYVIDMVSKQKVSEGTECTVEFCNKKARGPVVQSALYSYVVPDDASYIEIFNSVKLVDGTEAELIQAEKAKKFEMTRDADLIEAITTAIGNHNVIQSDIVDAVCRIDCSDFSRRNVLACLKRWSSSKEGDGVWVVRKGKNNSNRYALVSMGNTH